MKIFLHQNDLPNEISFEKAVAIDTETMGLKTSRDRLCLIQISQGNNEVHLIKIDAKQVAKFNNLKKLLWNQEIEKIFHYARFDLTVLDYYVGPIRGPIWCTKIASKLCRTYTNKHGLSDLCKEILGVDLPKEQQSSNWGQKVLSENQQLYAANDVIYLHKIRDELKKILKQEGRLQLAKNVFEFLPIRSKLDLSGFNDIDIFAH
tara:strand:+ start:902 stop:1516 length:615 start_codon:yes stop_codon:yes gene_type:complete